MGQQSPNKLGFSLKNHRELISTSVGEVTWSGSFLRYNYSEFTLATVKLNPETFFVDVRGTKYSIFFF